MIVKYNLFHDEIKRRKKNMKMVNVLCMCVYMAHKAYNANVCINTIEYKIKKNK